VEGSREDPSGRSKMSEESESGDVQTTTEESTQNNSEGTTVLYAMTREALTAKDLKKIRDGLESEGFTLTPSSDGDNVMIQRKESTEGVDVQDVLGN
jgi:hypothetical protein